MKENHFCQRYSHWICLLCAVGFLFMSSLLPVKAATVQGEEADGFRVVAENGDAVLYLSESDGLLRVESKRTGISYDTKIMDGTTGNVETQENQKSDLVVSYFNDLKTGALVNVSDYKMAIANNQMEITPIENGVKISYLLGEEKINIDILPKYVDKEKMEELVIKKISKKERKDIFDNYYRLYKDYYVRTKDEGITELGLQSIVNLMYEVGDYTPEDLEADNLQYGWETKYNAVKISLAIEYTLDKDDLVVRIPLNECSINDEKKRIHQIQLLPYLLSSTEEENGYIVVPDGSGAVIEFNNGRITTTNYVSRVYGKDILLNTDIYSPKTLQASMPVIGMKYDDYGMMAIVEKGSSLAQINTEISGKSDAYNKAYFSFYVCDMEKVPTTASADYKVNKYTEGNYEGDIVVRYKMLDKDAGYSEMAKVYQKYLIDNGMLTKKEEKEEEAPLFLEVLGTVLRKERFLGVPYEKNISLTSFNETKDMMTALQGAGIDRLQVQYDGWMNAGMRHSELTKIKPEEILGGKSGFQSLARYAQEQNIGFYPAVEFEGFYLDFTKPTVSGPNSLIKKHGAKFLSGKYAQEPHVFEPLTSSIIKDNCKYWLAPDYLDTYVNKFMKESLKLGYSGISVSDLGNTVLADHNTKKGVNREAGMEYAVNNMATLDQDYSLLLSNPNSYAFGYADYVTDLPTTSNQYNVFDYDIPFVQMVLDGCVEYSMSPINHEPERNLDEFMLTCMESKTSPKFIVMNADESELKRTKQRELFTLNYADWEERIVNFYNEYNEEFYSKVANAQIKSHEYVTEDLRKITYTNGVTVYLNYGDKAQRCDKHLVEANGYLVLERR